MLSLPVVFVLLLAIAVYWVVTQIMPERRKEALKRPGVADGLLMVLNERRHADGLPLLEMDEDLLQVAERKAVHELLTGRSDEGWDYPPTFARMFGKSLIIEILLMGPAERMADRLGKQPDLMDGEWISCGIGVAGAPSSEQLIVAMVLCRQAWEPAIAAEGKRSLAERLMLG